MHKPVIEGNYKVTGDTRVIPMVKHEDDEIQWPCTTYISTDAREPDTFKEATTRPNGHLLKMPAISEVICFCQERPGL